MTYQEFTDYIQTNLKNSDDATQVDRSIFTNYAEGNISLEEAMQRFKRNNDLDRNIPVGLFTRWLESLGYKQ